MTTFYKRFTHKQINTPIPFWVLQTTDEYFGERVLCVTSISFCLAAGLFVNKIWRKPRTNGFKQACRELNVNHLLQRTTQFSKPVADQIRRALSKETGFAYSANIVSVSTLLVVLREFRAEKTLIRAFKQFTFTAVEDCTKKTVSLKDEASKQVTKLADQITETAITKRGFYRKFNNDHPFIRATTAFLKEVCSVKTVHIVLPDFKRWSSVDRASPKKRWEIICRNFLRFCDFMLQIELGQTVDIFYDKGMGHYVELFVSNLAKRNAWVSVLPISRSISIGFYLIAMHACAEDHPMKTNAIRNVIIARRIYNEIASKANASRNEKKLTWNIFLLNGVQSVLAGLINFLRPTIVSTVSPLLRRSKKAFLLSKAFAQLKVLNFIFNLCLKCGFRPMLLVDINIYKQHEWETRERNNVETSIVELQTPNGTVYMFSSNLTKGGTGPVETTALYTRDRHTYAKGYLFDLEDCFRDVYDAYDILNVEYPTLSNVNRAYNTANGVATPRNVLFNHKSKHYKLNGKYAKNPPFKQMNGTGDGGAYSLLFTKHLANLVRSLGSKSGLTNLFGGVKLQKPIFLQDLKVSSTGIAVVHRLHLDQTLTISIYDIRRSCDTKFMAAVSAAESITEYIGSNPLLAYAKHRLETHLKITDHSFRVADQYYNQSGFRNQLIDFGKGFETAFMEPLGIDEEFTPSMSPGELDAVIELSHRKQGLWVLKEWVRAGKVKSPLNWFARFAHVFAHVFTRFACFACLLYVFTRFAPVTACVASVTTCFAYLLRHSYNWCDYLQRQMV